MQNQSAKNRSIFSLLFAAVLASCLAEDLVELTCNDVSQCKQFQSMNVTVSCNTGRCQCINHSTGDLVNCKPKDYIKSNIIGGSCPCTMSSAECDETEKVCYCAPNFVASTDRRRCLQKRVSLGEKCELDSQCTESDVYAKCDATRGVCHCAPGFAQRNKACLSVVGKLANCTTTAQCRAHGQQAICSSRKCLCPADYVTSSSKETCTEAPNYGSNCTEKVQCLRKLGTGGVCTEGVCKCADTHFVHEGKSANGSVKSSCQAIAVLGSYCRNDGDCYQHHIEGDSQSLRCLYGECNCRMGYISINKNTCTLDEDADLPNDGPFSIQPLKYLILLPILFATLLSV